MKKRVYFDTSALIKEFVSEEGSELVDKITTAAREQRLQIISSVWSINESLAVIDRLSRQMSEETRRPKLSAHEKQEIIATFIERVSESNNENSNFFFAPIAHESVITDYLLLKWQHHDTNGNVVTSGQKYISGDDLRKQSVTQYEIVFVPDPISAKDINLQIEGRLQGKVLPLFSQAYELRQSSADPSAEVDRRL